MAIQFMDGFDVYENKADVEAAGGLITEGVNAALLNYSQTLGRFGGGCLTGTDDNANWELTLPTQITQNNIIFVQWAGYYDALDAEDIFRIRNNLDNVSNMRLALNTDGSLDIIRQTGGIEATSAAGVIKAGEWHYFEISCVNANPGQCIVKVDGTQIFDVSTDFNNGTNHYGFLEWAGVDLGARDWRVDDILVMDDVGSFNNALKGDTIIETLNVDGDGGVVAWTRNAGANDWQAIDDPINSTDDGTTIVTSNTATQEGRYTGEAMFAGNVAEVVAVQVRSFAQIAAAGATTYRDLINSSASEAVGGTKTPATVFQWDNNNGDSVFDSDPNGVIAWTQSAVDALEFGKEIVTGGTPNIEVSSLKLEVAYVLPPPPLGPGARYSSRIGI